jgi:hypothetical protein
MVTKKSAIPLHLITDNFGDEPECTLNVSRAIERELGRPVSNTWVGTQVSILCKQGYLAHHSKVRGIRYYTLVKPHPKDGGKQRVCDRPGITRTEMDAVNSVGEIRTVGVSLAAAPWEVEA